MRVERPDGVPACRSRSRPRCSGGACLAALIDVAPRPRPGRSCSSRPASSTSSVGRPRRRAAEQFCDDLRASRRRRLLRRRRTSTTACTSATTSRRRRARLVCWGWRFVLLVVLQGFTGWTPGKLLTGIRVRAARTAGRRASSRRSCAGLLLDRRRLPVLPPARRLHRRRSPPRATAGSATWPPRPSWCGAAAVGSPIVVPGLTARPLPVGDGRRAAAPPPGRRPAAATGCGHRRSTQPPPAGPARRPAPRRAVAAAPDARRPTGRSGTRRAAPTSSGTRRSGAWMQWDEGFKAWSRIPGQ